MKENEPVSSEVLHQHAIEALKTAKIAFVLAVDAEMNMQIGVVGTSARPDVDRFVHWVAETVEGFVEQLADEDSNAEIWFSHEGRKNEYPT